MYSSCLFRDVSVRVGGGQGELCTLHVYLGMFVYGLMEGRGNDALFMFI